MKFTWEWRGSRPPLPAEVGPAVDLVIDVLVRRSVVTLQVGVRQVGEPRMLQRFAGEVEAAGEEVRGHPVLVVPFVSSRGRDLCKTLGLSFVDTVGNAYMNVPGLLVERSPRTHIDGVACPLMVIQGQNDPRVVEAESRDVVDHLHPCLGHAGASQAEQLDVGPPLEEGTGEAGTVEVA